MGRRNPLDSLSPSGVVETQGPLLRIPQDFFWIFFCISFVCIEKEELKKDKRRKGR